MSDDLDCSFTREIVCPHCFFEHIDSWEWSRDMADGDSKTVECESCGKEFEFLLEIEVTYSSHIIDKPNKK